MRERFSEYPQRFFTLQIMGRHLVGTKLISDLVTDHGHPGLFCSRIQAPMILGLLAAERVTSAGVEDDDELASSPMLSETKT